MLPSITIVTPSLNQGRFIRQTVDSVLNQDYPALNYIVMDGGSIDETVDILRSYGDRLQWFSQPDGGQSWAINQSWQTSSSEILSWLNSDDILLPGALKTVARFFLENPDVDMVYGNCDYINAEGMLLKPYPTREYDYAALLAGESDFIPQPATFIRRSVYQAVGPLDESLVYVMDLDYWLRAGIYHKVVHLSEKLASLRLHEEAKSISGLKKFASELIYLHQKLFNTPALPPRIKQLENKAMYHAYYRAADSAFWSEVLPEARKYAWKAFKTIPYRIRGLWIYLLMGKWGRQLAGKKYHNPYMPGRLGI
jgi:glycosyltransferase involved in cell wall biosynthesis